ncbi:hypothetical protein DMUE_5430 [Dictyocoela muelleri]|nr:hypothetical protein DMUE_5430 [Dictyocoela muelleri]
MRKKFKLNKLYLILYYLNRKNKVIKISQEYSFIPKSIKCTKCRRNMIVQKTKSLKPCYRLYFRRRAEKHYLYIKNLFLSYVKLNKKIMLYLYDFYNNIDIPKSILKEFKMSPNTYYFYKKIIEAAVIKDYILNKTRLGDMGKEVQVDESLFCHIKYNKGRLKKQIWFFGVIKKDTRKCFFFI